MMYCPKCSQQQISDEMRFCSRCGFPLTAVKELVLTGGEVDIAPIPPTTKGFKGAKQATWLMLLSLFVLFIVGLLVATDDDFAVLLIAPSFGFGFAFLRLLYAVFIEDRLRPREKPLTQAKVASAFPGRPIGSVRQRELSASPGLPIDDFTSRGKRTAEVVQPPSVTENTTRLFDDHADQDL